MRPRDLLTMPFESLWRRKTRTVLTTLGVVFGAFVLAASLSIGQGVQETINRESRRNDYARRIDVSSKWKPAEPKAGDSAAKVEGEMSEARRERLRTAFAETAQQSDPEENRERITRERLDRLAALPHVERLVPLIFDLGFLFLGERSQQGSVVAVRHDDESCRDRIVAGRFFNAPDERAVVLSEMLVYELGVVDEAGVEELIGKTAKIEFRVDKSRARFGFYLFKASGALSRDESAALGKVSARLPEALDQFGLDPREVESLRKALSERPAAEPEVRTWELPIIGVMRRGTAEEMEGRWDPPGNNFDALLPDQTAINVHFAGDGEAARAVDNVVLFADSEQRVKEIAESVKSMGLESHAAIEFIERERLIYLLIFGGMTCVAAVALLVAALGIANTMLMSVLERTREIGVMKAVGADDRHLLFMFLVEGALIGLVGAAVGLLLAWGASYPADAWVQSMVLKDMKIDLEGGIFVFPTWLIATVLIVPIIVTTLAALYPARRAARIDPVSALRHE